MNPKQSAMTTQEIIFPESDGLPMAETDLHRDQMIDLIKTLQFYYSNNPDVYVSGNLLLYWDATNPNKSVSPDLFVVKGVPKHRRRTYKVWEEGKEPDLVIEITLRSTKNQDLREKREIYSKILRVQEYFLFDPQWEYLKKPLMGYQLKGADYEPMEGKEGLSSEILGLDLIIVDQFLRFYDPQKKMLLKTAEEIEKARIIAEIRADEAEERAKLEAQARAQEADARIQAEERAKLEAQARAQEADARIQAEERAKLETQARLEAQTELEKLRLEIEKLRK